MFRLYSKVKIDCIEHMESDLDSVGLPGILQTLFLFSTQLFCKHHLQLSFSSHFRRFLWFVQVFIESNSWLAWCK